MADRRHLCIVGGGIMGLAHAWVAAPDVWVRTGPGGAGMTVSFGLTECGRQAAAERR